MYDENFHSGKIPPPYAIASMMLGEPPVTTAAFTPGLRPLLKCLFTFLTVNPLLSYYNIIILYFRCSSNTELCTRNQEERIVHHSFILTIRTEALVCFRSFLCWMLNGRSPRSCGWLLLDISGCRPQVVSFSPYTLLYAHGCVGI